MTTDISTNLFICKYYSDSTCSKMLLDIERKFAEPLYTEKIQKKMRKFDMQRKQIRIEEQILGIGKKIEELRARQAEIKESIDKFLNEQYELSQEYDDIQYRLRMKIY